MSFHFFDGPSKAVLHAVYAYRNADGGFGHGMEPDTASPESQPLFGIMALETLDEVGALTADLIAQDFLPYFASTLTEAGGIPWMFNPKGSYPRADHFDGLHERAALSTTAPLVGLLHKYGISPPWLNMAEHFVWSEIQRLGKEHIDCFLCMPRRVLFLEHTRQCDRARAAASDLRKWIQAPGVLCDRTHARWGLYEHPNSLTYATRPDSLLRSAFPMIR